MTYGYHDPFTEDEDMGEPSASKRESIARNLRKYDAMPFHAIASVMNMTEEEVKRVCQAKSVLEKDPFDKPAPPPGEIGGDDASVCECSTDDQRFVLEDGIFYCQECGGSTSAKEKDLFALPRETAFEEKVLRTTFPFDFHMTAARAIYDGRNDMKSVVQLRKELENDFAARGPGVAKPDRVLDGAPKDIGDVVREAKRRASVPAIVFREESTPGAGDCECEKPDPAWNVGLQRHYCGHCAGRLPEAKSEDELVRAATAVAEEKMRVAPCFPDADLERARKTGPMATTRLLLERRRLKEEESTPGRARLRSAATADADLERAREKKKAFVDDVLNRFGDLERARGVEKTYPGDTTGPLSQELLDIRTHILTELERLDFDRKHGKGAAASCDWTKTIEWLETMRKRVDDLLAYVTGIREKHGEPER